MHSCGHGPPLDITRFQVEIEMIYLTGLCVKRYYVTRFRLSTGCFHAMQGLGTAVLESCMNYASLPVVLISISDSHNDSNFHFPLLF